MALVTERVYLYPEENSEYHHTKNYEVVHDEEKPIAVLRRGNKFTMAVQFMNRDFDEDRDEAEVVFNYGPRPNVVKGTQGIVKIEPGIKKRMNKEQSDWFCNVMDKSDCNITLEVFAPPTISIGLWQIQVYTRLKKNKTEQSVYEFEDFFYFICNPWNCHDMVYMPEEKLLDEYILADVGKIWTGAVGAHRGRPWLFGQFDACVLPAIWLMLERSELNHALRGDPIRLSRTISKMVNANDDSGILIGRWDGEYDDGISPAAWAGSVDILEQYLQTQEPVKYGQCWVFAGVVTTICRAIGIPSRVVSNMVSAHDTDCTLSIDKFIDENNEEYSPFEDNNDSIWNYHVWNDVYMARPDLDPGFGGWQAIDATPQEVSNGFMQCGPASLEAIKKGRVGLGYDVAFLIATVNADYIKWKKDPETQLGFSKLSCNKYAIGKFILTKKPFVYDYNGSKDREDITEQYKPKENTKEERLALMNAVRSTERAKQYYNIPETDSHDVNFTLEDIKLINIGEDFQISLRVSSNSDQIRTIKFTFSAHTLYYNGVKANNIIKREGEMNIAPHATRVITIPVPACDYLKQLVEYSFIKIYAIATVVETKQMWADEDDFQVVKPNIKITTPNEFPAGKASMIRLEFNNPLKVPLTNCRFKISGPSGIKNQTIPFRTVRPGEHVITEIGMLATTVGEKNLVAAFYSKELSDITGSCKIEVV